MDTVSIVIPTFNRQQSLARALRSVCGQQMPDGCGVEVIVVDNSPDANASEIVSAAMASSNGPPMTIDYLHEPNPGVATARNTGVEAASGRWVAFLDDDEEASPAWISEMIKTIRETRADAVFGPVDAQTARAGGIGPLAPYFSRALDRADGDDITSVAAYLGTNNSMFDRQSCLAGKDTFDQRLNETGGEDSLLLKRLALQGRKFVWAANAHVTEWAAERRLNWAYVRKRKFLSGQIRVFVTQMAQPSRWDQIIIWMFAGLLQFILAGAAAIVFRPFNAVCSARASAVAWGGLGKVLWMPAFRPALYGAGLVS